MIGYYTAMRMNQILRTAALAGLAFTLVSCGSLTHTAFDSLPHFHEGTSANLVVIYYGEENIFVTKPDTRDHGFLPLMNRAGLLATLERPDIGHDLGVVVVGQMGSVETQRSLVDGWQSYLKERGFRRVVCLLAGPDDKIDGLPILRDSANTTAADEIFHDSNIAAVPSAP